MLIFDNELDILFKENYIITYFKDNNRTYFYFEDMDIESLYLIFKDNIVDETNKSSCYYFYLSHYYQIKNDIENAIKCCLLSIEKGNIDALRRMGCIYQKEKDYDNTEKYLILSIEKGDLSSYYYLANLYNEMKNIEKAEIYYKLAIKYGDIKAIRNLALLYQFDKKYENAIKYHLLAVENKLYISYNDLGNIYFIEGCCNLALKNWLLGFKKIKDLNCVFNLGLYYYQDIKDYQLSKKYYLILIDNFEKFNKDKGCYSGYRKNPKNNHSRIQFLSILATIYFMEKNYESALKYWKIGVEYGCKNSLKNIIIYYILMKEDYENGLRYFFLNYNNNLKVIKAITLKFNIFLPELKLYNNKKYGEECHICFEKKMLVLFDCGYHELCKNCYIKINKCSICRYAKK